MARDRANSLSLATWSFSSERQPPRLHSSEAPRSGATGRTRPVLRSLGRAEQVRDTEPRATQPQTDLVQVTLSQLLSARSASGSGGDFRPRRSRHTHEIPRVARRVQSAGEYRDGLSRDLPSRNPHAARPHRRLAGSSSSHSPRDSVPASGRTRAGWCRAEGPASHRLGSSQRIPAWNRNGSWPAGPGSGDGSRAVRHECRIRSYKPKLFRAAHLHGKGGEAVQPTRLGPS